MANEWTDPDAPRLGGLSKEQEREVADQLERSFGLNPEWGWLNIPDIVGNASRVYNMSDEDWDKMFKELPYYGQFQDQDINAIQEHFLSKYPLEHIPILSTLAEKYGIDAGTIPSDAAYQKIMSISPDALSGVKTTGLDSYQGPIAETIEYKDVPKMAKGGLLSGAAIVGEAGPELVVGNAEVVPLPDSFHAAQDTIRHERWLREEWVPDASYQELFESGWIEEAEERAGKERRDKRSQQKWDAIRRARQYDAIAKRLGT